jgi:hypothetical protein
VANAWILTIKGVVSPLQEAADVESIKANGLYTEIIPYVQGVSQRSRTHRQEVETAKDRREYSTDPIWRVD